MEVHHHTHTARKKWTHYFWEFLMLFLAVFCGFLAEYKLEQTIERHREKEFILSMIEDAANDTANIHLIIPYNQERIKYADSLATTAINYTGAQKENTMIYKFHRKCMFRPDLVYPTERTLSQLKNSGGMRLIRKKRASDAIIAYDQKGKMLVNQQAYYEMYLTEATKASLQTLNFLSLWGTNNNKIYNNYDSVQLITTDKIKLKELGNSVLIFGGVIQQYINRLYEMEKQAVELIKTLKKEYHLK